MATTRPRGDEAIETPKPPAAPGRLPADRKPGPFLPEPSRFIWIAMAGFGIGCAWFGSAAYGAGYSPLHWSTTPGRDVFGGLLWSLWMPVAVVGFVAVGSRHPVVGGVGTALSVLGGALTTFFVWSNECVLGGGCAGRTFVAAGVCFGYAAAVLGGWGLREWLYRVDRGHPSYERALLVTVAAVGLIGVLAAVWNPTDLLHWTRARGLGVAFFGLFAVAGPRLAYAIEPSRRMAGVCGLLWGVAALGGLGALPLILILNSTVDVEASCSEAVGACVVGVDHPAFWQAEQGPLRLEVRTGSGPLARSAVLDDRWSGEPFRFVSDKDVAVGDECVQTYRLDGLSATLIGTESC